MKAPEAHRSHPPAPNYSRSSVPMGYVEDAFEGRAPPGRRRVSARLGWAGENSEFFSFLQGGGCKSIR